MSEKNTGKTDMEENLMCGDQQVECNNKDKLSELSPGLEVVPDVVSDDLKEFGLLTDMKTSEDYLLAHPEFIHESTALGLLRWCTTLSRDGSEEDNIFNTVSTQCLYILYLLDLARQVDIEPIYCVAPFFARISEPEFREMFEKEIIPFRQRLINSSWDEVIDEVLKANSSDDDSSLSLNSSLPDSDQEVDLKEMYQSLPPEIQSCIDNEDIEALEAALNQLPDEVADSYMNRFLQAGLFIPLENDNTCYSSSSSVSDGEVEYNLGAETSGGCRVEDISSGDEEAQYEADEGSQ
ncbi:hypothetical protein WDU94_001992 [Cyamophila willieti]